jgi:hypothetical protein
MEITGPAHNKRHCELVIYDNMADNDSQFFGFEWSDYGGVAPGEEPEQEEDFIWG